MRRPSAARLSYGRERDDTRRAVPYSGADFRRGDGTRAPASPHPGGVPGGAHGRGPGTGPAVPAPVRGRSAVPRGARTWRDEITHRSGRAVPAVQRSRPSPGVYTAPAHRKTPSSTLIRQLLAALIIAAAVAGIIHLPFGIGPWFHGGFSWAVRHDTDLSAATEFVKKSFGALAGLSRRAGPPAAPVSGDLAAVSGDERPAGGQAAVPAGQAATSGDGAAVPGGRVTAPGDQPRWVPPVQGDIIGGFGWRPAADGEEEQFSPGILLAVPADGAVKAAAAGLVTGVTLAPDGRGIVIDVDHGGGWATRYGGLARAAVEAGEAVAGAQTIGLADPDGDGIDFEMIRQGVRVDPEPKLRRGGG